jgi:hypothetical protein
MEKEWEAEKQKLEQDRDSLKSECAELQEKIKS